MENEQKDVEKNLVVVERYPSDMDAEMAKSTLNAAGIDCIIMRDGADGMLQVLEYTEGVRVLVNEDQLEEAKALLEEQSMSSEGETDTKA